MDQMTQSSLEMERKFLLFNLIKSCEMVLREKGQLISCPLTPGYLPHFTIEDLELVFCELLDRLGVTLSRRSITLE